MSSDSQDFYELFRIPPDATDVEVKSAFRRALMELHPGRHQGLERKAWAEERVKRIHHAYSILGDDAKRLAYDSQRRATSRG